MIQKMKTLLIDDEPNGIENLQKLLDKFCPQVEVIATGNSLEEAESIIHNSTLDLVFLDIQIGSSSIFDLLKRMPKMSFEIIFVSAHNHALEAFDYKAVDYLLKPISIESLIRAVNRAFTSINDKALTDHAKQVISKINSPKKNTESIAIPTSNGYEMINVNDILYCIADGSYTEINIKDDRKILGSKHLKFYVELLKEFDFMRIHNSILINPKHIKRIKRTDGGIIEMQDGKILSISKSRKEDTFKRFSLK